MASKQDLSTAAGVLAYLALTPFTSDKVVPLSGGSANFVYRVHLRGHASLQTVVLKYAAPYLATDSNFPLSVERMAFEVAAMKAAKAALPADVLTTIPTIHHFDDDARVVIMDDCGDAVSLKQLMLDNPPLPSVANVIGKALGEFLGRLHTWGVNPKESQHDLFDQNKLGKTISGFVTYGRLISTLNGKNNLAALSDAPLNIPQAKLEIISKLADERRHDINTCQDTLTMGDFWPGNILVNINYSSDGSATTVGRIHVVDWELVKPGLAGLDVGQFCAEMHLLRRFSPACEPSVSAALKAFLKAYRGAFEVKMSVVRVSAGHIGAHWVAWTPRVPWGSKELTREIVQEGVEYLVEAYSGDVKWLEGSIVGALL